MKRYQLLSIITILAVIFSFAVSPYGSATASAVAQNAASQPEKAAGLSSILAMFDRYLPTLNLTNAVYLRIRKVADAEVINAGDPIGFTIRVGAVGELTLTNVVVTDQLNPEYGWTENSPFCDIDEDGLMTCNFGDLAPDGTIQTVHLAATSNAAYCGVLDNTAVATSDQETRSVTASVTVNCSSNVTVEKSPETATIQPGDTARFNLLVSSNGDTAAQDVTLEDALPTGNGLAWSIDPGSDGECVIESGVLSCSFGEIAVEDTRIVTVSTPTTVAVCGDIDNTATVSATNQFENAYEDDSSSATITVSCSTLMLEKVVDDDVVEANGEIGYTMTVTNTGASEARNVTLSDQLAGGTTWSEDSAACSINSSNLLTCNFGALAVEQSASVYVSGTATVGMCGVVDNTATVRSTNMAGVVSDDASVEVVCAPSLSVVKTPSSGVIAAGEPVVFTMTVTNTGTADALNVLLNDPLPPNTELAWAFDNITTGGTCDIIEGTLSCSFGTLPAGQTASVRVSADTTPLTCGSLINTVTAEGTNVDPVSDIAGLDVTCSPNLTLEKEAEMAEIRAGNADQPARFIITVTSNGSGIATNVILTDELPTNTGNPWVIDSVVGGGSCEIEGGTLTCDFGDLPAGQVRTVTISSPTDDAVLCLPQADRQIVNLARVTSDSEAIEAGADNTAMAAINVLCTDFFCDEPDTIYFNDFNSNTPGTQYWSSDKISTSPNGTQTFLGDFSNNDVTFNYTDTTETGHQRITISFDLYVIRTWDGNTERPGVGPDEFSLDILDAEGNVIRPLLYTTFSNFYDAFYGPQTQSYPKPAFMADYAPLTGAEAINSMGYMYDGPRDAVYHFTYSFPHTDDDVIIRFSDGRLQGLPDESWGIDNFQMTIAHCDFAFGVSYRYLMPQITFDEVLNTTSFRLEARKED